MDLVSLAARTRLRAKWRTTAMFLAPNPLRRRDWSSAQGHVQHPVQSVFDPPVAADRLAGSFGVKDRRGDVVAGLFMHPAASLDAGLDADDAGDIGQAEFAWEATVAGEPIDLSHEADGALLDTAVPL